MKKICTRCEKEKNHHDFQKRAASTDGLTAACKSCLSKYDRQRSNQPKRVEARLKYSKTERGKQAASRAKKRYQEKNKIKRACHIKTGNAIKSGHLKKQPCEHCQKTNIHAHHDDYANPLDVRWLCPACHKKWHRENGEGLNSK